MSSEARDRSWRELENYEQAIAHDLRGPILRVTTFLDLLRRRSPDGLDDGALALTQRLEGHHAAMRDALARRRSELRELGGQLGEGSAPSAVAAAIARSMAAVVADLVGPLAAARADARDLIARLAPPDRASLAAIGRAHDRVAAYLDAFTSFLAAGRGGVPASSANLELELAAAIAARGPALERVHGCVRADPLPSLRIDARDVRLVLGHLLDNAIGAAIPGRPLVVHVASTRDGESWHLRIHDDGSGIPAAHAERAQDLLGRPEDRGNIGLGMGLATCRRAVESSGGRIELTPGPGGGTEICLTWPVGLVGSAS